MKIAFITRLSIGATLLVATFQSLATPFPFDNITPSNPWTTDSQSQWFSFTVTGSPTTVTMETSSYANNNGFDPFLNLFDNNGLYLTQNDDKVVNSIFDSYISLTLAPGTYNLLLTQAGNAPNLASNGYFDITNNGGYQQSGNYTGSLNGCANASLPFCDGATSTNRQGYWALNIDGANSAQTINPPSWSVPPITPKPPELPEPSTTTLLGLGLAGLLMNRKRRKA